MNRMNRWSDLYARNYMDIVVSLMCCQCSKKLTTRCFAKYCRTLNTLQQYLPESCILCY